MSARLPMHATRPPLRASPSRGKDTAIVHVDVYIYWLGRY